MYILKDQAIQSKNIYYIVKHHRTIILENNDVLLQLEKYNNLNLGLQQQKEKGKGRRWERKR